MLAAARRTLEDAGATVLDVEPDLDGADAAWEAIELFGFGVDGRARLEEGRSGFREDYLRNVREGRALDADTYAAALAHRTELYRRTAEVLADVDAIIYPATPVAAPPAEVEWVAEIDGVAFDRYFLWQRAACRLTVTAHPVLATPAGMTSGASRSGCNSSAARGRIANCSRSGPPSRTPSVSPGGFPRHLFTRA